MLHDWDVEAVSKLVTMIWYLLGACGIWRRMLYGLSSLGFDITRKLKQSMPLRESTGEFREAKDDVCRWSVKPRTRHHYDPGSKTHKLLGLDEPSGPVTSRISG